MTPPPSHDRHGQGPRDDWMPPGAGRRSRTSARRRRAGRKAAFVVVLGVLCATFAMLAGAALLGAAAYVDTLPDIDELNPVDYGQNSTVFANLPDGRELKLATVASSRNRQPLPWRKISPRVRSATIAIEDRRFWDHGALDYEGIARAAWRNITSGQIREGASTITQQVVRNLYLPEAALERTWQRKVDEAWLALQLEDQLDEGRDPDDLPQHRLLRQQRLRRGGRGADLLLEARRPAEPTARPR